MPEWRWLTEVARVGDLLKTNAGAPKVHFALMPEAFITLAHFATSWLRCESITSGVEPRGTKPRLMS
jgi:hypothetical protein